LDPGVCERLGNSEIEMKEMIRSLGKYVRKKKLNVEKTKMVVFNKRKRKSEENERKWGKRKENRTSERIQVLGLHLQRKSYGQGTHEREIVGCVWGIGERK
jgi:hypothetical protein